MARMDTFMLFTFAAGSTLMLQIHSFTFSPFSENMYIVYDESGDAIIFDPGCYNAMEEGELAEFLKAKEIRPVRLVNTHAHIDHILGNYFVYSRYGLLPEMHKQELPVLARGVQSAMMYALRYTESPQPEKFLEEGQKLSLNGHDFEMRFAPGHSPGSLIFIHHEQGLVIGGDVLFRESIGRSDLPGGNHETLLHSITTQLYTLPDHYEVFPGHGPSTTIGHEKRNNPFIRA